MKHWRTLVWPEANYAPAFDHIVMPPREVYFEPVNWYRTALHKIGHNAATRIMPRGLWLRVVFWS
ncbi:zincin-like metallopeptidase domain-containing protein [Sphingobium sp. BHU LFT2]|uniref:zincin-like metallopeptidase domain-containing protein n=1 Tax=Sphingobium sp. BHU LFT2 TaxID=2807634 RepID=UPI0025532A5C|nr:zincin-like metallopeptidase domain-containing protein [Sphingobium sp. BHU LFT2]